MEQKPSPCSHSRITNPARNGDAKETKLPRYYESRVYNVTCFQRSRRQFNEAIILPSR